MYFIQIIECSENGKSNVRKKNCTYSLFDLFMRNIYNIILVILFEIYIYLECLIYKSKLVKLCLILNYIYSIGYS